jgi:hypothetical protein
MTDRFVDVLRSARLSGGRAVTVTVGGNPTVPPLSLLQVTGRCGLVLSPGIGRWLRAETLEGSDLFVPENESTVLLSTKAASALSDARLLNVEIALAGLESAE